MTGVYLHHIVAKAISDTKIELEVEAQLLCTVLGFPIISVCFGWIVLNVLVFSDRQIFCSAMLHVRIFSQPFSLS